MEIEHKDGSRYEKTEDLLSAKIPETKNLKEAFGRPDPISRKLETSMMTFMAGSGSAHSVPL